MLEKSWANAWVDTAPGAKWGASSKVSKIGGNGTMLEVMNASGYSFSMLVVIPCRVDMSADVGCGTRNWQRWWLGDLSFPFVIDGRYAGGCPWGSQTGLQDFCCRAVAWTERVKSHIRFLKGEMGGLDDQNLTGASLNSFVHSSVVTLIKCCNHSLRHYFAVDLWSFTKT